MMHFTHKILYKLIATTIRICYNSVMKKNVSWSMSAVLLAVLCLPYVFKKDDSISVSDSIKVSRQKYDLYSKLDGLSEYDLARDMLMILTEEAMHSTNPLLRYNRKLKLNGFGLQITDEDVTNTITNDKQFNFNKAFDNEEYEKFLRTNGLTDEIYREYVRECLAAKMIADIINNLSKYALMGMHKYISNLIHSCKQQRSVTVQEINIDDMPKFEITEDELFKTFLENQNKFKTKRTAKIELVHYKNTKEMKIKLREGAGRRDLESMTMSDISRLVKSEIFTVDVIEDDFNASTTLPKEVMDFLKKHVHYGEKYKGLMSYEHEEIVYFFKFTEYKKSEVDVIENVADAVKTIAIENKMKEHCLKKLDELVFVQDQQMLFNLVDVVPYMVMPVGKKETADRLAIGRAAFQLDQAHANMKLVVSNGKIYKVTLNGIQYNDMSAQEELQYREHFKRQIAHEILYAYIDRIMNETWPAKMM